jgi:ankyrin repeat protein
MQKAPLELCDVESDPIVLLAKEKASELRDATAYGSVDVVAELCASPRAAMYIDQGIGPFATTALMSAAQAGRLDAVRVLLDAGADVDACDSCGRTALMFAAANGESNVFSALIERGAAVGFRAQNGWSSLMFACGLGHHRAAAELLLIGERRGDAPDDMQVQSALGLARAQGQKAVISFLEALLDPESAGVAAALERANEALPPAPNTPSPRRMSVDDMLPNM